MSFHVPDGKNAKNIGSADSALIDARSKEILDWLSATDYQRRCQGELQKRTAGTGK